VNDPYAAAQRLRDYLAGNPAATMEAGFPCADLEAVLAELARAKDGGKPGARYRPGDIIGETTEDGGRLILVLAVGHEAYFVRHLGGLGALDDTPDAEPAETAWPITACEAVTYLHQRPAATPPQ
jgi:hypothetical protein